MTLLRDRPCSVDGCDALVGRKGARGLCHIHYKRVLRHGDPSVVGHRWAKRSIEERFWSHVDRSAGPEKCWPWTAFRSKNYGKFNLAAGDARYAHRFALELSIGGPIPKGMYACHRCDNPPCCNPAHLYVGTPTQNLEDAYRRGRLGGGNGGANRGLRYRIKANSTT